MLLKSQKEQNDRRTWLAIVMFTAPLSVMLMMATLSSAAEPYGAQTGSVLLPSPFGLPVLANCRG